MINTTDQFTKNYKDNMSALRNDLEKPEQTECEDAINRRKAISVISACDGKSAQIEALEKLPSVQPKIKTGHWIFTKEDNDLPFPTKWYKCSECGKEICEPTPRFCDECGTKIIGIKDEAEK